MLDSISPVPITHDARFVAQSCRYVLASVTTTAVGASSWLLSGGVNIHPVIGLLISLGLTSKALWESLAKDNQPAAYRWLLGFSGFTGFYLAASLSLVATSLPNGSAIITLAAVLTVFQTLALTYYAYYVANFSEEQLSIFSAGLASGLTGLCVLGVFNLIVGLPASFFLQGFLGVGLFSAFLVYDVHRAKTGGFRTPVEAALNIYLDIINLFVHIVVAMQQENRSLALMDFAVQRMLPLLIIVASVFSLGYLEQYLYREEAQIHEQLTHSHAPSFLSWLIMGEPPQAVFARDPASTIGFSPVR